MAPRYGPLKDLHCVPSLIPTDECSPLCVFSSAGDPGWVGTDGFPSITASRQGIRSHCVLINRDSEITEGFCTRSLGMLKVGSPKTPDRQNDLLYIVDVLLRWTVSICSSEYHAVLDAPWSTG